MALLELECGLAMGIYITGVQTILFIFFILESGLFILCCKKPMGRQIGSVSILLI